MFRRLTDYLGCNGCGPKRHLLSQKIREALLDYQLLFVLLLPPHPHSWQVFHMFLREGSTEMCSECIMFLHWIFQIRKYFWMVYERVILNGWERCVCFPECTLEQEPAVVQVPVFLTCLSHVAFHLQATSIIVLF